MKNNLHKASVSIKSTQFPSLHQGLEMPALPPYLPAESLNSQHSVPSITMNAAVMIVDARTLEPLVLWTPRIGLKTLAVLSSP